MPQTKPTLNLCNHYDITGCVNVTNTDEVSDAVCSIFLDTYGKSDKFEDIIRRAFLDFHKLYSGAEEGYHACDTLYHDIQHTLDMSLAMARLLQGYEKTKPNETLGALRFTLGIITSLFHDSGYIRKKDHDKATNGAFYTLCHVTRSAEFLQQYLPKLKLGHLSPLTDLLVHFTGYETPIEDIYLSSRKDRLLGYLLGTADLLAQFSDRCYLEKCRDRLFPEFVLGGLTTKQSSSHFQTAEELLLNTPRFFQNSVIKRLNFNFEAVHKLEAHCFNGQHLYMDTITTNIEYLQSLIEKGSFDSLNRCPPSTLGGETFPFSTVRAASSKRSKAPS